MDKKIRVEYNETSSERYRKAFFKNLRSFDFDEFIFSALKFVFDHADFDVVEFAVDELQSFVDEFKRRQEIHDAIDKVMDQFE